MSTPAKTPPRLVGNRRAALTVMIVSAVLVTIMGIAYHDKSTGTAFDGAVDGWIRRRSQRLLADLVHLADPPFVALLFTLLIIGALWRRRWDIAALAVLTPFVSIMLVEHVGKPLVNRTQADEYVVGLFHYAPRAFPSGHESGIGSFLAVCVLLVINSGWQRARRIAALTVIGLVALIAAIGLVGRYYHYATDTIGAVLVCTASVLASALVIDAAAARLRARGARARQA